MAEAKKSTGTALTFKDALSTALEQEKFSLPKNLDIQRFTHNAVYALSHNDTLVKFSKEHGAQGQAQIKDALLKAAYLGLDIGISDDYYLYPYGSALNFSLSPRGAAKMVRKYSATPVLAGPFTKIHYEGEPFQDIYENGIPWFEHKPFSKQEAQGKAIVGAFAWIIFEGGYKRYEYMTIDELNACRNQSKMANAGAWKNFPIPMYSKTVLHRLCRNLDLEFGSAEQKETFYADTEIETEPSKIRDVQVEQNANSVDFEDANIIDGKAVEKTVPNDFENISIDDAPFK